LVFRDEQLIIYAGKGIFDQGVVFLSAEQDAEGWVVVFGHNIFSIPAHVGVELTKVFMSERFDLQLHQNMSFENAMIEDQIHKSVGITDQDSLLPRLETKAVAQLQ